MTTARITALMLDGTKHETTGIYMPLSDRVAFERKFASSILDMARQARNIGPDGIPSADADLSGLNEERAAFFSWRVLRRGDAPCGEFDDFLDGVEEVKIDTLDGPADPTDADPLAGTPPS